MMDAQSCDKQELNSYPSDPDDGCFLFLCRDDRQEIYQTHLFNWDKGPIKFFNDVEKLLQFCLLHPPRAVIIDVMTQLGIGSKHVNYLYDLRMSWPVMRSKDLPDGSINVMCNHPHRTEALIVAIDKITSDDPEWVGTAGIGKHIRMAYICRARYREAGDRWHRANTLDISSGGLFLVTYFPMNVGARIELELLDIGSDPVTMTGIITKVRDWEESASLPGIAVSIEDRSSARKLAEFIASHEVGSVFQMQGMQ